ncbi:MAG: glycosyltransferase family 4 protein [Actinomycetota bacterium]|nr:glycosyltransferase family 4 protein [Actinomycetota bacterium]
MRILIWHGYLLGGTGSNVYTRSLARAWQELGHDVTVLCQEPHPEAFDLAGATVLRPDIGEFLPVFVLDRYDGMQPRLLSDLTVSQRLAYVAKNVEAIRDQGPADFLLANHVLLGGPVAAGSGVPFAVKAHGSELEYSMRDRADLCGWARETLASARVVLAGSRHIEQVLEEVPGRGDYSSRVRVIPPGVDVESLVPADRASALAGLLDECRRDPPPLPGGGAERLPDPGNADRLATFFDGDRPTVVYVGKLSAEKGVSMLLDALTGQDCRAVIVGFGPARAELERQAGRTLGPDRVVFPGPLEHRHLRHLWPLATVSVVPSVFPEAFGMVAAEAASCGCPPLVARHSGLAEIAAVLEGEYPPERRHLAGFRAGDGADLHAKLAELNTLPRPKWLELSAAARRAAVRTWGWPRVATRILAAMGQGGF